MTLAVLTHILLHLNNNFSTPHLQSIRTAHHGKAVDPQRPAGLRDITQV